MMQHDANDHGNAGNKDNQQVKSVFSVHKKIDDQSQYAL